MHKILIVDDDASLRSLFTAMLTIDNYSITVASDGQEAIKKLNDNCPDILVLDMNLPHVSGFEVMRYVRSDEQFRDLRVIILSANSTVPSSDEAELADVVLMKPVTLVQLQTMVRRLTGSTGTLPVNDETLASNESDTPLSTTQNDTFTTEDDLTSNEVTPKSEDDTNIPTTI